MSRIYKIYGQKFRMIQKSTLENDYFIMQQLRRAGLENCTPNKDESAEDFGMRLLYSIVEDGVPFELLGGLLIPENVPDIEWTPGHARATADILRVVTDPEDKQQVQSILISLLTDFFAKGLPFLNPSQTVSQPDPEEQPGEKETKPVPNS